MNTDFLNRSKQSVDSLWKAVNKSRRSSSERKSLAPSLRARLIDGDLTPAKPLSTVSNMDLVKRFSLDNLVSGASQAAQRGARVESVGTRSLESAVSAYVSPVLKALESSQSKAIRLLPLFDSVRPSVPESDIWQFREVIKYMQDQLRLIRIVESDPHGNDLIQRI
jgi:hypothetical protein